MQIERILHFLSEIKQHNNRPWFLEHRAEYDACRADFLQAVGQAIERIALFDPSIAHLTPRDCIYRFNRDTRFSPDKSPYKRHFGAYICPGGKKSLQGGYYIHLEPGHCFLSVGTYYLPTNILTSCRNEIMGNIDAWLEAVESDDFVANFGRAGEGVMGWDDDSEFSPKGFGLAHLKTTPKGFPRDYEHIAYLRMKDYCTWRRVDDSFFEGDKWIEPAAKLFQSALPMMKIINSVVADYE